MKITNIDELHQFRRHPQYKTILSKLKEERMIKWNIAKKEIVNERSRIWRIKQNEKV